MQQTYTAVFDGEVFRPTKPVGLAPDSVVRITVSAKKNGKKPRKEASSFLRVAAGLRLRGPRDWSEHFEDYLTGRQKLG
jgi:hypothetical protein